MSEQTQAQHELVDQFRAARRVSTPLISITTPDPGSTERLLLDALAAATTQPPVLTWDVIRGVRALNEEGFKALAGVPQGFEDSTKLDPIELLTKIIEVFPGGTCLFLHGANRYLTEGSFVMVIQAIWNLRDEFKSDRRTLVLLSPQFQMPIELSTDVVQLDDPYPDDDQLQEIVKEQLSNAGDEIEFEPTDRIVQSAAAKLKGTAAFAAEQLTAMAIRKDRVDGDYLNVHARKLIGQTKGLTFESGTETFDDIGGLEFIKKFGNQLFAGPEPPTVIVRIEELEKSMAGAKGDLSGTSGDALQVMLSAMEDNNWSGLLAYGAAGCCKSLFAKSLANTYDAKPIRFDVNSTKQSLVGSSEANIREALKVIKTIGGSNVFFVASVNRLEALPPELQRRFRCGVWFFDVPDHEERATIWEINLKRFGHTADRSQIKFKTLDEPDLTGADIRNICEMAHKLSMTLEEARQFIVPMKTQNPQAIADAREIATNRFISASHGGVYQKPGPKKTKRNARQVSIGHAD